MKNQAALITGGAKRIGRDIVLHLAKKGFDIALHYNASLKDAKLLGKEIQKIGRKYKLFRCDLSNILEILKLIKKVKKHTNNIDLKSQPFSQKIFQM